MTIVQISPFTKKVIEVIRKIPEGKVATYKQVAALAGKPQASRGVSWILHSCSTTYKLPWHRVLNSQGKISFDVRSQNYRQQRRRLEREGIVFSSVGALDLDKFQWKKRPSVSKNSRSQLKMFNSLK